MTTIFYSIEKPRGNIVMYNPDYYDVTNPRRVYVGYSLREAKHKFKLLLGITTRVHWEEM